MDHLPWSELAMKDRPVVPFVARIEDIPPARSFQTWDVDRGWNLAITTSMPELAAKSQSWLYFGLLSAVLDDDLNVQMLVQNGAVCTHLLHATLLADARRRINTNSRRKSEIRALLSHAWYIFENVIVPNVADRGSVDAPDNIWEWSSYWILFSVSILIADLKTLFPLPKAKEAGDMDSFVSTTTGIAEAFRIIGRCPSLPRRMNLSAHEAYRLLSWTPSNFKTHDRCTVDSCSLFHVNEQQYKPQHHDSCSDLGCRTIGFEYHDLCAIMDNNCVPLVRSTLDARGQISLSLEAGTLDSKYTAISHVWAGGLGNFQRNQLHECQLVELHKALDTRFGADPSPTSTQPSMLQWVMLRWNALQWTMWLIDKATRAAQVAIGAIDHGTGSHLYWIDTLCVPVKPNRLCGRLGALSTPVQCVDNNIVEEHVIYDTYRQTAIDSMARIYAGAEAVLVVDPELQKETACKLSPAELRLAVFCCPWMARSWCFSEGALAMKVNLKFADTIIPFSQLGSDERTANSLTQRIWAQDIKDPWHPELDDSLALAFFTEFQHVFTGKRTTRNRPKYSLEDCAFYRFVRVWNELAHRSTTKSEDVAAIIAALLNLSSGEVLGVGSPFKRMKALLKSQSFLPVDLLFCTTMAPEVPGDWTPLFPNSNTAPMRIGLTSRLELRDSGLFFIWKSSLLYSYSLHHLVPTGKVCIQMSGESNLRLVSFRNGHRAPFGTEPERILLWFSTRVHEPGRKAGRWFKVIEEHTDALRLSMGDLFHWEIVVDKQGESLLPEAHVIKCGDTFQSMSLMIDLDIGSWPTLSWSRMRAGFPFIQLAMGQLRPYSIFKYVFLVIWFFVMFGGHLPIPAILVWPKDVNSCTPRQVSNNLAIDYLRGAAGALAVSVPRFIMCGLEANYLADLELRWVQKTWAASFWDIDISNKMQTRQQLSDRSWEGNTVLPANRANLTSSHERARTSTTMADTALRRSQPMFAINALIYHAVMCIINGMAFAYASGRILGLHCQRSHDIYGRPRPSGLMLEDLTWNSTHDFVLSFLARSTLIVALEMVVRLCMSTVYVLGWALLALPSGIGLPRSLASTRKAIAHALAVTIPWAVLVFLWLLILLGTALGLKTQFKPEVLANTPDLDWFIQFFVVLSPLIFVWKTLKLHYMTIRSISIKPLNFCRSCLATPAHTAARIIRNITRRPGGQIRLPPGDEDPLRANEGAIALR